MTEPEKDSVNALGEPMWLDVLRTSRAFAIFMILVVVVGGGLGIAVIAPWGRASPDCSIYCVIANKLGDPIRWDELATENLTEEMIVAIQRELNTLEFSFSMPNYKQHGIWLTGVRYETLVQKMNHPMVERKSPNTNKNLNIAEELYELIKSSKYSVLNNKEKIKKIKKIFNQRKDIVLENEFDIARPDYEIAAELGNANAQYKLGVMYHKGVEYEQDHDTAVKWYMLAAEQGHVRAQYALGQMYNKGSGVPRDYEAAVKWYTRAAERQDAKAQHKLGLMYFNGHGVPQDKKAAQKWWKLSSKQGFAGS